MPNVVFKSVESFSSEDPNFPASNLLAKEARKWKCREAGEKSALVVLRLEKPLTISGVDIGNEHSAFVEVLVARSGPSNPEFKEILLTSSFMSPIESRNSTSTNRVRCFTQAELIESVARCQWDLVKIICTQPFNSRVQYGISFVTLHCPKAQNKHELEKKSLVPDKFKKQIQEEAEKHEAPKAVKLGRFIIREESPDSDETNNSSALFARWKESRGGTAATVNAKVSSNSTNVVSTAAAIRNASTPAVVKNKQLTPVVNRKPVAITPKVKPRLFDDDDEEEEITKPLNRNRESLLYDKDDDKPNEKLEKKMAEDRARIQREKVKSDKEKRDHLLAEKKSKGHDTSVTKFKDFLFEDPPGTASGDSSKKTSSSQEKRHRSRSPPTAEKPKHHKRRDSGRDSREEHRERERKPSEQETKKRPSESPRDNSNKKQKHQLSGDEYENRKGKPPTYKHFNKLLENVVLVISGIQNPDRANLRTQALAMGAKYKSDWDSSCTHLICAFKNTPKYNQVHGKGKIVKKGWIERCHALRKRLSWRKFALDSNEAEQSDSEGEIIDISKKPSDLSSFGEKAEVHSSRVKESKRETDEEALSHYDLDDVVLVEDRKPDTVEISGSDTEEEIERVKEMHKKESGNANGVYDKSTEDEGTSTTNKGAPLDFFKGQTFFIDSDIGAVDIIKLERYVTLYTGTITKTTNEADYVVTRNQKPMGDGFKGQLIKPLWVYECHDMECLIPIQRYQP